MLVPSEYIAQDDVMGSTHWPSRLMLCVMLVGGFRNIEVEIQCVVCFAYCTAMPNLGLTMAIVRIIQEPALPNTLDRVAFPARLFPYSPHSRGRKSKVIDKADI